MLSILSKLSFWGILLYLFCCYIGSTAITISFIAVNVFLLIDISSKAFIKKEDIRFVLKGSLLYLAISLLLIVIGEITVDIFHHAETNWLDQIIDIYKALFIYFWLVYAFQNFKFQDSFQLIDLRKTVFGTAALGSLISSIYVLFQFLHLLPLNHKGHFGIITQPFTSSGLIIAGIFCSLYFFRQKFPKKYLVPIVLLQVIGLLLLGQVSSWFGLIIGFLLINFRQRIVSFKILVISFILSAVVLGLATQSVPRIKRKLTWFTSIEKLTSNRSIQCRIGLWQANFKNFDQVLLFGRNEVTKYTCEINDKAPVLSHAHNIYLQPLFEGGVFKLILWLSLYLGIMFALIRTYSENQVFLGYFYALSVEGLFEYWWGDSEVKTVFLILMFSAIITSNHFDKTETI